MKDVSSVYQQRAIPNLNELSLRNGKLTISQALTEFNSINEQASPSVESGLRYAARDLYYTAGVVDKYDFCSEIQDKSSGPYKLECLQKMFITMGGQKTGTMYPSEQNLAQWDAISSWRNVKNYIQQLQADTTSITRSVQDTAIKAYYGITTQEIVLFQQIPGVEIFWFSLNPSNNITDSTIFFGRRIRPTIPSINPTNELKRVANMTMVSMEFFTNIQFPGGFRGTLRIVSGDGASVYLNKPISTAEGFKQNAVYSDANSIVGLPFQPPTQYTGVWSMPSGSPNVVSGFWCQAHGGLYYSFQYNDTKGGWNDIPSSALFLTQEAFAPMVNFQVYTYPVGFGADFNFADVRMGGLKMKWSTLTGTPGWDYLKNAITGVPCMNLRGDCSVKLNNTFKMYSFMTMTFCIQFNALPNNFVNMQEFISMNGQLGKVAFRVIGNGSYGQGVLQVYCDGFSPVAIGTVKQGVPYLIVLRVNREIESDIYTVNNLSAGAQELTVLQADPTSLQYTAQIPFATPSKSNPNSNESRNLVMGNSAIDVFWIHMYDYYLDTLGIGREARNDWKYLKKYN